MSVSGSSATGHCSNVSNAGVRLICRDPTSSVLFDGVIPTLTGLDGDMWASQLLTLQRATSTRARVLFDFTDTPGYVGLSGRFEVVMFNCPNMGISASTIRVSTSSSPSRSTKPLMDVNIGITSCDSLVTVCTPINTIRPSISLQFPHSDMVYLAEVTFYDDSSTSTCSPDTIITTAPPDTIAPPTTALEVPQTVSLTTPVPDSTSPENNTTPTGTSATIQHITSTPSTTNTFSISTHTHFDDYIMMFKCIEFQCEVCPSCSTSIMPIILTSVISVVITALLATVIFVLVQIAVCKFHPKFTPGGAETGASVGGEGQVYEQVDGAEGGVAVSDPTYMEVGAGGGGGGGGGGGITFQLKENEAYAVHTK